MLTFVGLGLYDERDITRRGLEAIRSAEFVYLEEYTSRLGGCNREKLEGVFGRKVLPATRTDIENDPEEILRRAASSDVVLLTGGDPMSATTHIDLRLRAHDRGIKTRIIHAPSIFTAVAGITGLSSYKFGKSATISYPWGERGVISEVPYDTIKINRAHGLHTLLLLDISNGRCMRIHEALKILSMLEEKRDEGVVDNLLFVGVARAGSEDMTVKAGDLETLMHFDFGPPLHVLVAVGELHFIEHEALVKFAGLKGDL
ncbi:MAG TPA: diphthine synthase [Candidatus Syntrophoarchaeum butanivorans]|uniref:Diphthine synthase n=1 Tax=Candidatus Syntropharchaeum butanivorans TaxID=1839936 RepID=A0A1F2P519_9EURY|nr:MAG: diphthine synthase [Candidatus Syntrophoarchaeum butanivorans]HEC56452.1 diphthine synthase [Candidatus Syntrophoarchaeum butanivorans]